MPSVLAEELKWFGKIRNKELCVNSPGLAGFDPDEGASRLPRVLYVFTSFLNPPVKGGV